MGSSFDWLTFSQSNASLSFFPFFFSFNLFETPRS
jgi:hypothetical protein